MSASMLGEALRTVCGPLGDLNQKLSGPNGEEWLTALKRFLRKENPWDGKIEFPVFRTITLGHYKKVEDVRKCLERQKVRVSNWASDIMDQPGFTLASEKADVNLVVLSVAELGFSEGATLKETYARAQELGLHLCPAEVGPALRYQYPDQPPSEWLTVAMEPIAGSLGYPGLFDVGRGDVERWLSARWSDPAYFWHGDDQFVFAK